MFSKWGIRTKLPQLILNYIFQNIFVVLLSGNIKQIDDKLHHMTMKNDSSRIDLE